MVKRILIGGVREYWGEYWVPGQINYDSEFFITCLLTSVYST